MFNIASLSAFCCEWAWLQLLLSNKYNYMQLRSPEVARVHFQLSAGPVISELPGLSIWCLRRKGPWETKWPAPCTWTSLLWIWCPELWFVADWNDTSLLVILLQPCEHLLLVIPASQRMTEQVMYTCPQRRRLNHDSLQRTIRQKTWAGSNLYLVMVPHELERLHCKLDLWPVTIGIDLESFVCLTSVREKYKRSKYIPH